MPSSRKQDKQRVVLLSAVHLPSNRNPAQILMDAAPMVLIFPERQPRRSRDSASHGKKEQLDLLLQPPKLRLRKSPKERQVLRLLPRNREIEHQLLPLVRRRRIDRRMALAPSSMTGQ